MNRVLITGIPEKVAKLMNPEQYYTDFEYKLLVNDISEAERIANEMLLFILQDYEAYDYKKYKDSNDPEKQAIDAKNAELVEQATETLRILRDAVPVHLDLDAQKNYDWRGFKSITVSITKKEDEYSNMLAYVGEQIEGTWVHMLPPEDELIYTKVVNTISVNAEICASDFVQGTWFNYEKNAVGIIFQGIANRVFNEDVFSFTDIFGERKVTIDMEERGRARIEAWINPQMCTPTALVVHPDSDEEVIEEVREVAEILDLQVFVDTKQAGAARYRLDLKKNSDLYSVVKNMILLTSPSHIVEYPNTLSAFLTTQESIVVYNELTEHIQKSAEYTITEKSDQILALFPEEYKNYYFFQNPNKKTKYNATNMLNNMISYTYLSTDTAPVSRLLSYLALLTSGTSKWIMIVDNSKLSSVFEATAQFFAENQPVQIDEDGTNWFSEDTLNKFIKDVGSSLAQAYA